MSIQFLNHIGDLGEALSLIHIDAFPKGQGWSVKDFKEILDISFHYILIDYDFENKIRGFLLYSLILDEAEILTFVVCSAYQKQGVGRDLMASFLEKMQKQQVKTVFLDVAEDNIPAITLYNQYGFVQNGKRKKYYENKTDALLMIKKL